MTLRETITYIMLITNCSLTHHGPEPKYKMPLLFTEQNILQIDYIFWQVQSALGIEKINFILKHNR